MMESKEWELTEQQHKDLLPPKDGYSYYQEYGKAVEHEAQKKLLADVKSHLVLESNHPVGYWICKETLDRYLKAFGLEWRNEYRDKII